MARLEVLIPFILYFEAGGAKSCFKNVNGRTVYDPTLIPIEKQFLECKAKGLTNDPDDKGGLTMNGVTFSTYSAYCNKKGKRATADGLKNMTYAEWFEILKTMFWDKWKANEINDQSLANILVDWVWASGITGIKRPQRILGVTVDGIVGPKTIAAVNSSNPKKLFDLIKQDRLKHFDEIVAKSPSQKKFLNGWRRRVNCIEYGGFNYNAG